VLPKAKAVAVRASKGARPVTPTTREGRAEPVQPSLNVVK